MLSQYTEQKSLSIQNFKTDQLSNMNGNCQESRSNSHLENGLNTRMKLKKLQELYQQGLEKLAVLNRQNEIEQKQKKQIKQSLQQKLTKNSLSNHLSSTHPNTKTRKRSETSTAGEDEESKINGNTGENSLKTQNQPSTYSQFLSSADEDSTFLSALKEKLLKAREQNAEVKRVGQEKIVQLRNAIVKSDKIDKNFIKLDSQISQTSPQVIELQQKLAFLQSKKSEILSQQTSLAKKITETKQSIDHLSNSTEYLRTTQNCCQQILNEQLCSLQYKLQGRRLEYDSNKRYLDKIIRTRKYEENVSFQEIRREIDYLNEYCEEMIQKKKEYYAPEINKYKKKRLTILEQIKDLKEKYVIIQKEKNLIELKTKEQNKLYDELQDQYCELLEKIDDKTITKGQELSIEEKVKLYKEKKDFLTEELKQILVQYQQIKLLIDNDKSLVPLNIIKDFRKKTQRKKQEIHDIEILTKENFQLQKDNKLLTQEKDGIEWKANPDIQKLTKEEKDLKAAEIQLKQTIKELKEKNQSIEQNLNKLKQAQKLKKQEEQIKLSQYNQDKLLRQKQQQEKKRKQEEQKILLDRSKLIEKFREKPQQKTQITKEGEGYQDTKNFIQKEKHLQENANKSIKQNPNKPKKSKYQHNKDHQSMRDSKSGVFFGRRENPHECLRRDFPLNSSQEISQNISLLQSNPALYMMVIFVTVVIPGLIIGYKFRIN